LLGGSGHRDHDSLADKIATVPNIDWRWVEIMIGIRFTRVRSGGSAPSEVRRRACAPWQASLQ
jgi:hypothetical protein